MKGVKKNFEDLPEDWKDLIIDNMSNGVHKSEVFKILNITPGVHNRFYEEHQEYADVFDQGKMLLEAWWDKTGRENIDKKTFNHGLYIFIMKSVFKRRDNPGYVTPSKDEFANDGEKERIREQYRNKENSKSLQ
jgi:hypothetical protein